MARTSKWLKPQIAQVIMRRFGVSYTPSSAYSVALRIGWKMNWVWWPPDQPPRGQPARRRENQWLTAAQIRSLDAILRRGPKAAGYENGDWTGRRVREVIRRRFGVLYEPSSAVNFMRRMGWERRGCSTRRRRLPLPDACKGPGPQSRPVSSDGASGNGRISS
jgi:transposase